MQWNSYMPHYYNYYATIIVKKGNYAWRTLATILDSLWSISVLKSKKTQKKYRKNPESPKKDEMKKENTNNLSDNNIVIATAKKGID